MVTPNPNPFQGMQQDAWMTRIGDVAGVLFARSAGDRFSQAFLADVGADYGLLAVAWQRDPGRLLEIQQDWLGRVAEITAAALPEDDTARRRDAEERSGALHRALGATLRRYVDDAPLDDEVLRTRLGIAADLWISALAPENFLFSNPAALDRAEESQGASVLQGLDQLRADLDKSPAALRVSSADEEDFRPGESLALSSGEVIFENELLQLIQYYPTGAEVGRVPMLIIPPWINRYYVLDLTPQTSMVRWLVSQGHTVFMISWRNPGSSFANTGFGDYLDMACLPAIEAICEITGEREIGVTGYCIGGVLAACLAAWRAAAPPGEDDGFEIHSLTLLNTLLDCSDPGEIGLYLAPNMMAALESEMADSGYLDGRIMGVAFSMLRAEKNYWPQFARAYLEGRAPARNPLASWNFDVTNLPARMAREYLHEIYMENRLTEPGAMQLSGRALDLSAITVPCIVVACERDHLVPWRSAWASATLLGGDTRFVLSSGGHVSGILQVPEAEDSRASFRSGRISGKCDEWKGCHEAISGSWWTEWQQLLAGLSADTVAARFPGSEKRSPVEPAPGRYVLEKPEA